MAHLLRVDPTHQLQLRSVAVPEPLSLQDDGRVLHQHLRIEGVSGQAEYQPHVDYRPLPQEFYLRQLLDFDIESDRQLLDLMKEFGALGIRVDGRESAHRQFREWQNTAEDRHPAKYAQPLTTIEVARADAAVLRNAARCLLADAGYMSEHSLLDDWDDAPEPPHSPASSIRWLPSTATEAISDTARLLDKSLGPFHPRVFIGGDNWVLEDWTRPVSLFAATCAQMFNHIAENATYRECERDDCRHVFVRQLGRAEKGQHRTREVKYCSKVCAATVADRKRRTKARDRRDSVERTSE